MKLPDKFWFYHKSNSGEIFFARKMGNDYFVSNSNKETFVRTSHEVEEYFSLGYLVLTVPESPLKRISINVNDVRAAAEFDVANNPHTKAKGNTVEEIEREILGYLKEMYDALMNGDTEWKFQYTGARTYRILFQPEDDSYGTILILSDTSIGMPTFFAYVNDFLSQN